MIVNVSSKVEEASVLKQCVHAAQQEAARLLTDKQELLEAVRKLQVRCSGQALLITRKCLSMEGIFGMVF